MKNRTFVKVILAVIIICLALTMAHAAYAVYAYQHCSVIQFIAKELW